MSHRLRNAAAAAVAVLLAAPPLSFPGENKTTAVESKWLAWRRSPTWMNNLVIYVVATKAFTSPHGPESGTFESLARKLPYLQELGITAIWLTGHSRSDGHHFFNVWTQYACVEPDKIDPSLGTPQQFKTMIDQAHRRGIKVFVDVITHGVMAYSPLVKSHPEWFRGGSWGMIDYDWNGGHTDLDDWWVKTWSDTVTKFGVDGFRLDLGIHNRPDLWARVRQNAVAAGHPIVIFEEGDTVVLGVTDFSQGNNRISSPVKPDQLNPLLIADVPAYYDRRFGRAGKYDVKIEYEDGGSAEGDTTGAGMLRVRLDGITVDRASARAGDRVFGIDPLPDAQSTAEGVIRADGVPDVQLTLENAEDKHIRNVTVTADNSSVGFPDVRKWDLIGRSPSFSTPFDFPRLSLERQGSIVKLYIPTLDQGNTIELSAHDNGWWEGVENPYVAQGSRALFGYSLLFMPRIPLFMSGEEFDATFHPLPGLSVDTVGHKNKGRGRILLGSMLDWQELAIPGHRAMFEDVKKMLSLRVQEKALLSPMLRGDIEPKLVAVSHSADIDVPVPYMRWDGEAAIVVVANRNAEADAHLTLNIPLEKLGQTSGVQYRLTDLWNGSTPKVYGAEALSHLPYTVKRDKTPRRGLGVIKIERVP